MRLFIKNRAVFLLAAFLMIWAADGHASSDLSFKGGLCVTKAQALYSKGQVKEAIQMLDAFLKKFEADEKKGAECHYLPFLMGNYHAQASALKEAARCYQKALAAKPDFVECHLNLARCAYEMEDYKAAALSFEKAYEHCPQKKAQHLYYASVCRFQNQEYKKALALFQTLMEKHPEDVTLTWKEMLVNILFSLERYKSALPWIRELAFQSPVPKQKKWQEILLQQYLNLEMDNEALALADRLTRMDPSEPKWWKGLTHVHLKLEHRKEGLAALLIYGFLTPLTETETSLAADLFLSLDVPEQAAAFYQALQEKEPTPKTLEKLVQAFALAHEPDQALEWIEKGQKVCGKEMPLSLLMLKARLLYIKKFWKAAASAYGEAALVSKKPGRAWLMMGYASLNASDLDVAEKAFLKARKSKEQKKQAQEAIAAVHAMKEARQQVLTN